MILTQEEYERGFICFDASLPNGYTVELFTRTADSPERFGHWDGPYTDPEGSLVTSPPMQYYQISWRGSPGTDSTKTPDLARVRWERDGWTYVWPGPKGWDGPPSKLVLGRDYGYSYRLVIQPIKASWPEPFVIIDRSLRIRFSKGQMTGHRVTGFRDEVESTDGTSSVEGIIQEITADGDLIEILSTVWDDDEELARQTARRNVEAALGLLTLCFGEEILGEQVFSEHYSSSVLKESGDVYFPLRQLVESHLDTQLAASPERGLTSLRLSPFNRALSLALRWYEKGASSESPLDSFVAFFIGLEALCSGFFASLESRPERREHSELREYFAVARPEIDANLRNLVLCRLADYPLAHKFQTYWDARFAGNAEDLSQLPALKRLRDNILHGEAPYVDPHQLNTVRRFLEKSLAKELGLDDVVADRQSRRELLAATLSYDLHWRGR